MLAIPSSIPKAQSWLRLSPREAQKKSKAGDLLLDSPHNNYTHGLSSPKKHKMQVQYIGYIKSSDKKLLTSSQLAIVDPPRDITVPTTSPKKFLTQDFIGPRFTKMPMTRSPNVTLVSVKEKFRNVMKCLKIPSKFVKSLTCGA
ncbi:hypothetical protein Tco_1024337 [Tanacetum coccineum]